MTETAFVKLPVKVVLAHRGPDLLPNAKRFRPKRFLDRRFSRFEYAQRKRNCFEHMGHATGSGAFD